MRYARNRDTERGSVTLEAAIGALGLLLIISLGWAVSRIVAADHAVTGAAADAARRASLARDPATARADARTAATNALTRQDVRCRQVTVRVDTGGFAVPVGQPATVTVRVTCRVELADLTPVPGLPGVVDRTSEFTSPLDQYRERGSAADRQSTSIGSRGGVWI